MNALDRHHEALAATLWEARAASRGIAPLRERAAALGLPLTAVHAYAVQRLNSARRAQTGDRVAGRKIGLTSPAVQKQLGVDSPDYGDLWASDSHGDGATLRMDVFIQPKVEAEVALVLARDLDNPQASAVDVIRCTDFAVAALEIVDSRIADWKISLFDTIADNASGAAFVLGADPVRLSDVKLRDAAMRMTRDGNEVSTGIGSACLGHPLNAAAWLARELARLGTPLRAGDILLTGALGPMVAAAAGNVFEARIEGLGGVAVRFE